MRERWLCHGCDEEFSEPDVEWEGDVWFVPWKKEFCPLCGSEEIERLEECPSCDGGWLRKGEECCRKCQLRGLGALGRFARDLPVPILRFLDGVVEGTGLEDFR